MNLKIINNNDYKFHYHIRKKCIEALMDRRFTKEIRAHIHELVSEIEIHKLHEASKN